MQILNKINFKIFKFFIVVLSAVYRLRKLKNLKNHVNKKTVHFFSQNQSNDYCSTWLVDLRSE